VEPFFFGDLRRNRNLKSLFEEYKKKSEEWVEEYSREFCTFVTEVVMEILQESIDGQGETAYINSLLEVKD
jgi:hypothetical protein